MGAVLYAALLRRTLIIYLSMTRGSARPADAGQALPHRYDYAARRAGLDRDGHSPRVKNSLRSCGIHRQYSFACCTCGRFR